MAIKTSILAAFSLAAAMAMGCGGGTVTLTGSCPCTVGNSGIQVTLACGESTCADLNGTATGYTCTLTGLEPNATICSEKSGGDAGEGHDAGKSKDASSDATMKSQDAGVDAHKAADGGGSKDAAVPFLDATGPEGGCASLGDAGSCFSASECQCDSLSACSFACGSTSGDAGPSVSCVQSTCNVGCAGNCQVGCTQSESCTVNGGAGAYVGCGQSRDCNAVVGANGTVDCTQAQSCTAKVGANATVDCTQAGSCDVTCPAGCQVTCTQAEACSLTCGAGQSCSLGCDGDETLCPDGHTQVCGSATCPM